MQYENSTRNFLAFFLQKNLRKMEIFKDIAGEAVIKYKFLKSR